MEAGASYHQDPKHTTRPPGQHAVSESRIGSGWVAFAGSYLMIAGMLNLIWGIAALSKKSYFVEGGLVWSSLETWAWIALIAGTAQLVTGLLLFARKLAGVIIALVIAMCGMLVNFLSIGAYPVWSIVALICNALVLWAVTVHAEDFVT